MAVVKVGLKPSPVSARKSNQSSSWPEKSDSEGAFSAAWISRLSE